MRKPKWVFVLQRLWGGEKHVLTVIAVVVSICCQHCNPRSFFASCLETLILMVFQAVTVRLVGGGRRSGLSSGGYSRNALPPASSCVSACDWAFDTKSYSKPSVCFLTLLLLSYPQGHTYVFTWLSHSVFIAADWLVSCLKGGAGGILTALIPGYHSPKLIRIGS